MRVRIKKWGNGASVCIPATAMAAASLSVSQAVEVRAENGRIVIESIRAPTYTLDALLADMKPETYPR
jgi:antitoxin MazE